MWPFGKFAGFFRGTYTLKIRLKKSLAQSAGAVEYTDCTSVEG